MACVCGLPCSSRSGGPEPPRRSRIAPSLTATCSSVKPGKNMGRALRSVCVRHTGLGAAAEGRRFGVGLGSDTVTILDVGQASDRALDCVRPGGSDTDRGRFWRRGWENCDSCCMCTERDLGARIVLQYACLGDGMRGVLEPPLSTGAGGRSPDTSPGRWTDHPSARVRGPDAAKLVSDRGLGR